MKKINLLVIALLFGALAANANPIDASVAQKVAGNFYATTHGGGNPALSLAYTDRDAAGTPVYYVFNVNTTKGFIIVTADDAGHPIIGYSNEGAFVIPTPNNNVDFWLGLRKKEVIAIRAQHLTATSDITKEWTTYTSSIPIRNAHYSENNQLCQTTWNQSPYYNAMCPGGSVTGCVATAMAQIMRYWKYPAIGTGSNCYYDEQNQGYSENYGELCATFDTSHYIWSGMPLGLSGNNNQVAKLMYDCGVSVNMDYSPTGSGAEVIGWSPSAFSAYTTNFGYDASTINTMNYSNSQQATFISTLENEFNNGRPVQYQGTDPNEGGHSWVCDGYSSISTMHMNWGWGGYNDGWFAVSSLNPSGFDFSQYIAVIYGIQPPPGALGVKQIVQNAAITVYPNPSHGVFNFTISNSNNYEVRVYNVLGQEVNTAVLNSANNALNLGAQPKGVYIYKLLTEAGSPVSTGRLIVE